GLIHGAAENAELAGKVVGDPAREIAFAEAARVDDERVERIANAAYRGDDDEHGHGHRAEDEDHEERRMAVGLALEQLAGGRDFRSLLIAQLLNVRQQTADRGAGLAGFGARLGGASQIREAMGER